MRKKRKIKKKRENCNKIPCPSAITINFKSYLHDTNKDPLHSSRKYYYRRQSKLAILSKILLLATG